MLPAAEGQPEVIQAMRQGFTGDGDAEAVGGGEIGQRLASGIMALGEENLPVLTVEGVPFGDPPFKCPAHAVWNSLRPEFILKLFKNRHGHDARYFEHLQNLWPDPCQRIEPGPPSSRRFLLK